MKILSSILFALLLSLAAAQVIGIDLGTEFWKASLISPGKNLVIVENSRSSRKSHNGIAFLQGVRHFEYDAYSKRLKKPAASYFYLNKLVESLDQTQPLSGYRYENGTYFFQQDEDLISLEQLVGMIMKNIKKFGSAQAGSDIKDAVLTVPAHWGFKARMSLVNAASIADLSILGVINENSAAAIHFAITRNDTDPVNIGFFNLGSHNLQISIVQFFGTLDPVKSKNIESMRVLAHVSIPNVGGLRADEHLAEHIAKEFKAKHKLDIKSNDKAWVKLLHKCADLKQTLSANKEAHIYVEAIIGGIDLSMTLKREILEQAPIFPIINEQLAAVVSKAGLTKDQISLVEVIGGASRIPLVGKMVRDFFDPVEVGSHINGDESMAFGSALRAANLSIAFRVKQLHFYDGYANKVRAIVSSIDEGVIADVEIFDENSEQGLRKQIPISQIEEDIKVTIVYGDEIIHEYIVANNSIWREKYNATQYNFSGTPNTILVFQASSITIAELKEAYINVTLNTTTTKEVYELVTENITIDTEEKSKTDQNQTETNQDAESEDKSKDKEEEKQEKAEDTNDEKPQNKEESETEAKTDSNSTEGSSKSKRKRRERTRTVKKLVEDFKIEARKLVLRPQNQFSKYKKYTKEEVENLRLVVARFEKNQNYINERAKIRNDFESTLYALKDDFENPALKTFSTEEELEKLKTSVGEELVWLEDNAWTAEKVDFEKHFRSIQRVYNPIVNRSQQYKERENTYNKTIEVISLVYQKTVELNSSQPWVSEKALAHLQKVNETVEWIHSNLKKQGARQLNEDAVLYNHQMIDKAEDLRDEYYLIKMIPRPKAAKKPIVIEPTEDKPKQDSEEEVDLDVDQKEDKNENQQEEKQDDKQQSQEEAKQDL